MDRTRKYDRLKELRQLAIDAEEEKLSENRTQCGALVQAVELFLQHLKESAVEINQSPRTDKGFETVLTTSEHLDNSKRYALVLVDDELGSDNPA